MEKKGTETKQFPRSSQADCCIGNFTIKSYGGIKIRCRDNGDRVKMQLSIRRPALIGITKSALCECFVSVKITFSQVTKPITKWVDFCSHVNEIPCIPTWSHRGAVAFRSYIAPARPGSTFSSSCMFTWSTPVQPCTRLVPKSCNEVPR